MTKFIGIKYKTLLIGCLLISGCVERKITVNTNPSGAQVFLNDEEIGVSPVTTSFKWYGNYNVTIRKQGFETLQTTRQLKAPLHDYFPFDFLAQVVYPGTITDSYEWSFDLIQQYEINRQELIKAAQRIKNQAER